MDDTAHEQAIISRQLFAGHVVGSRPMKREKNLHRMIMYVDRGKAPHGSAIYTIIIIIVIIIITLTQKSQKNKFYFALKIASSHGT